jgi:hypothetical protein
MRADLVAVLDGLVVLGATISVLGGVWLPEHRAPAASGEARRAPTPPMRG